MGRLFGYLLLIPFKPPLKVSVNWLIFANTIKLLGRSFTLCDLICLSHINKLPSIATKNSQVVRKNFEFKLVLETFNLDLSLKKSSKGSS